MAESVNEIKLKITIDGKEATAVLNLTDTNIKELYKSFKYGKQEVNGFVTSLSQGLNNAREMIIGAKEAFGLFSSAFSKFTQDYAAQEQAEIALQTAMKQTGNYTEDNFRKLKEYASQLQQTTLYGDEATTMVMSQLMAMGLTVDQTKQATLHAANLATIMGTDLAGAAKAMADLFNGNGTMIGRYVKGLDETITKSGNLTLILKMLNERIGGQAEAAASTASGGLVQMDNAISDLSENMGMLLANGMLPIVEVIRDFFTWINNTSPALSAMMGIIGVLIGVLVTLKVTGLLGSISALMTWTPTILVATGATTTFTGVVTAAGVAVKGFFASLGPIGWIVLGVSALATAFTVVSLATDDAASSQKNYNDEIERSQRLTSNIADMSIKQLEERIKSNKATLTLHGYSTIDGSETKSKNKLFSTSTAFKPLDDEGAKILKEENIVLAKELERKKKAIADANKDIVKQREELEKRLTIDNLKDRERELKELEYSYKENKKIAGDNHKLLLLIEENFRKEKQDINDKYDSIERKKKYEKMVYDYEKAQDETKKAKDLFISQFPDATETKIDIDPSSYIDVELQEIAKFFGVEATARVNTFFEKISFGMLGFKEVAGAVRDGFEAANQAIASAGAEAIKVFDNANSILEIFVETLIKATAQSLIYRAVNSALNFAIPGIGGLVGSIFGAASGAVVTKPTLMVVGEGKEPEGVFPLSYLKNNISNNQQVRIKMDPVEFRQHGLELRGTLNSTETYIKTNR